MSTTYTCTGPVRGDCGHTHTTPQTAGRCCQRDDRACSKQGGYSGTIFPAAKVQGCTADTQLMDLVLGGAVRK